MAHHHSAPPPPPPPPPAVHSRSRGAIPDEEGVVWSAERIHAMATETLLWCTNQYKRNRSNREGLWYVILGASVVSGFAALGLAALPAKGRGFVVNCVGFWIPAVVTIRDTDRDVDTPNKPWAFTGYWVRADDTTLVYSRSTPIEGGNNRRWTA